MKQSKLNLFIDNIVQKLISRQLVEPADAAIYAFGIRTMIIQSMHFIIIVVLGILTNALWENLLFLFAFLILRVNAGGYHAPTNLLCYLITFVTDLAVLLLIIFFPAAQYTTYIIIIALAAAAVLFRLAPVENEQKLLDTVESSVYYRRTVIITLLLLAAIVLTLYFDMAKPAFILMLSISVTSLFVAIGYQQNKKNARLRAFNQ